MMFGRATAISVAAVTLAGCAAPVTEPLATARHVGSNDAYGSEGTRMHLFVFDPIAPRSLEARKDIARRSIALDPSCVWIDAPDDVLIEATARQGAQYSDTLLVAPLRCSQT